MGRVRRSSDGLVGAAVVAVLLMVAGCGIADDDATIGRSDRGTAAGGGPAATRPPMRPPASLCERISQDEVERITGLLLEPGNPSEENDFPHCTWRRTDGDVAVVVGQADPIPTTDLPRRASDAEEVPNLGTAAVWSPSQGVVWVLTDEGLFTGVVRYRDPGRANTPDAAIAILRTVMATTEVPDTTTTSPPTTAASEPVGLCGRVSFETVETIAGEPIEPGRPATHDPELSCEFRTLTGGWAVQLVLQEAVDPSVVAGYDEIEIAGRKARTKPDLHRIYVETSEGTLSVALADYELTDQQVRSHVTRLVEEFLASA